MCAGLLKIVQQREPYSNGSHLIKGKEKTYNVLLLSNTCFHFKQEKKKNPQLLFSDIKVHIK